MWVCRYEAVTYVSQYRPTAAKKWEQELQTLGENNARLSIALQESTNNVEHWKKQLLDCKEEGDRLQEK
ncbi:hypothetical protein scyTo_0027180, partial [Scyliorhinus torazame]|nr:hypothetical protein [Scyliorhinus torazame]